MKRAVRFEQGKTGLELLEQATHLLRTSSAGTLANYYFGALPFVLCLLYFWADMSRSPFADQHLASGALSLAVLFLWMKFWQVLFLRRLRAAISKVPNPPLTFKQCGRVFIIQAALQPLGLFLVPLALVLTVPFGWVFAFFQNLTALCDVESTEMGPLIKKSIRQAALWPGQNHVLLALLSGFGFCVLLNWGMVCYILPNLIKMLFGSESVFTRSSMSLLNTTFFAAMLGLTYLCVDPLLKAVYALRCFYGESLESGEDIKADLKQFAVPLREIAGLVLLLFTLTGALRASGGQSENRKLEAPAAPVSQAATSLSPSELELAIQGVAQKSKYAWRMPRERVTGTENAKQGLVDRFLERVGTMFRQWLRAFGNWLDGLLRKLFSRPTSLGRGSSGYGWIMFEEVLLYALVGAAAVGLAYALYRIFRNPHSRVEPVASEPLQLAPDLSDENLGAGQLPEDGWSKLGRDLLARGELRLALRAFYLASLAHLAERNLISLAKFKSNRDYLLELQRRAHSFPDLLHAFGNNVEVFDRTWYGLHQATADVVNDFASNVERIRSGV